MKFVTLIPNIRGDGNTVPVSFLEDLVRHWTMRFGGCSIEGTSEGLWMDPDDQKVHRDTCWRVCVVCDNELYNDAKQAIVELGKELGQRSMYFEVRDFDGVRMLRVT